MLSKSSSVVREMRESDCEESGFTGKRNNRSPKGLEELEGAPVEVRSYSSIMLSKSSSVVREMRESKFSQGNRYLSVKARPFKRVVESLAERSDSEAWQSTTTMRVSPPT
ncbi:unnamed protein product [Linum trigynum]|uniref:Uncharacterized protein n=1 Tax=Linum trigynum TaxID=586398 RepID=A0AAV2ENU5_9ROSI